MANLPKPKALERKDIRPCDLCNKPHTHLMVYRVRVETHVIDMGAMQRTAGMEMFFGGGHQGARLADIMGGESAYSIPMVAHEVVMCMECAQTASAFEVIASQPDDDSAG